MPSESSIKKAEILLAQLANKQAFLDSLRPVDKNVEPKITVTAQKVTTVFVPSKENESHGQLLDILNSVTTKEMSLLVTKINELLTNE